MNKAQTADLFERTGDASHAVFSDPESVQAEVACAEFIRQALETFLPVHGVEDEAVVLANHMHRARLLTGIVLLEHSLDMGGFETSLGATVNNFKAIALRAYFVNGFELDENDETHVGLHGYAFDRYFEDA